MDNSWHWPVIHLYLLLDYISNIWVRNKSSTLHFQNSKCVHLVLSSLDLWPFWPYEIISSFETILLCNLRCLGMFESATPQFFPAKTMTNKASNSLKVRIKWLAVKTLHPKLFEETQLLKSKIYFWQRFLMFCFGVYCFSHNRLGSLWFGKYYNLCLIILIKKEGYMPKQDAKTDINAHDASKYVIVLVPDVKFSHTS